MINIHEKLWVIKGHKREVEDSNFLLAYMTHQEYTKTGEESSSFSSRKDTGTSWAKPFRHWNGKEYVQEGFNIEENSLEFDNTPVTGFRIVGSVSRWSTSNKLIRVEDPRGFVVEIPTGNLTTLLKHTLIDHAEVKEECVWGREGNNHILLPVNSEVYQKAVTQTIQHNTKVSFTKLEKGDVVKFSVDSNTEFVYCGRGKAEWAVEFKQATENKDYHSYYYKVRNSWKRDVNDKTIKTIEIKDSNLCFIFKSVNKDYWEYKSSGKCTVIKKTKVPKIKLFDIYIPDRVINFDYHPWSYDDNGIYHEVKTINIEMKNL